MARKLQYAGDGGCADDHFSCIRSSQAGFLAIPACVERNHGQQLRAMDDRWNPYASHAASGDCSLHHAHGAAAGGFSLSSPGAWNADSTKQSDVDGAWPDDDLVPDAARDDSGKSAGDSAVSTRADIRMAGDRERRSAREGVHAALRAREGPCALRKCWRDPETEDAHGSADARRGSGLHAVGAEIGVSIGAILFLPFLLVDLVVASVTTSIGMLQLPPVTISTPLKILLFVMVDGWNLLAGSLLKSFS